MLDFSQYHQQLAIFRTTTDGKLRRHFPLTVEDVPALFVIFRNQTVQRIHTERSNRETSDHRQIFNRAIRSYLQRTRAIVGFDDYLWEEISLSKRALKNTAKEQNLTELIAEERAMPRPVKMIDLELALFHMLRREVPLVQYIYGELYDALVQWLSILTKVNASSMDSKHPFFPVFSRSSIRHGLSGTVIVASP